jgi:hypothetical protein
MLGQLLECRKFICCTAQSIVLFLFFQRHLFCIAQRGGGTMNVDRRKRASSAEALPPLSAFKRSAPLLALRAPASPQEAEFRRFFEARLLYSDSLRPCSPEIVSLINDGDYCGGLSVLMALLHSQCDPSLLLQRLQDGMQSPPGPALELTKCCSSALVAFPAVSDLCVESASLEQLVALYTDFHSAPLLLLPIHAMGDWALLIFDREKSSFQFLNPNATDLLAQKAKDLQALIEFVLGLASGPPFSTPEIQLTGWNSGMTVCAWTLSLSTGCADVAVIDPTSMQDRLCECLVETGGDLQSFLATPETSVTPVVMGVFIQRLPAVDQADDQAEHQAPSVVDSHAPAEPAVRDDFTLMDELETLDLKAVAGHLKESADDLELARLMRIEHMAPRAKQVHARWRSQLGTLFVRGACRHTPRPWVDYKARGPCCQFGRLYGDAVAFYVIKRLNRHQPVSPVRQPPILTARLVSIFNDGPPSDLADQDYCPIFMETVYLLDVLRTTVPILRKRATNLSRLLLHGQDSELRVELPQLVKALFQLFPILVPKQGALKHCGAWIEFRGRKICNFDIFPYAQSTAHVLCMVRILLADGPTEVCVIISRQSLRNETSRVLLEELAFELSGFKFAPNIWDSSPPVWAALKRQLNSNLLVHATSLPAMTWNGECIFWDNLTQIQPDGDAGWRIVDCLETLSFGTFVSVLPRQIPRCVWAMDDIVAMLHSVLQLFGQHYPQMFCTLASLGYCLAKQRSPMCVMLEGNTDGVETAMCNVAAACTLPWDASLGVNLIQAKKAIRQLEAALKVMAGGAIVVNPPDAHMGKAVVSALLRTPLAQRPQAYCVGQVQTSMEEDQHVLRVTNFTPCRGGVDVPMATLAILWKAAPALCRVFDSVMHPMAGNAWLTYAYRLGAALGKSMAEVTHMFQLVQPMDNKGEHADSAEANDGSTGHLDRTLTIITDAADVDYLGIRKFIALSQGSEDARDVNLHVFLIRNVECFKQQELQEIQFDGLALRFCALAFREQRYAVMQYQIAALARQKLALLAPACVSKRRGRNPFFVPIEDLLHCFRTGAQ